MKPINENTAVSLGLVGVLIGGIFWLSTVYSLANNADVKATENQKKTDKISETLSAIQTDIAVIRQILKKDKN